MNANLKYKWWSLQNRLKGYQFRVIQRHRCCSHTTPRHYQWCTGSMRRRDRKAAEIRSWGGGAAVEAEGAETA